MELQTNSGQKVKLRIDIATRTRIDALGAPMLPCLKRGANVSSAIFDVISLKNWLCMLLDTYISWRHAYPAAWMVL